jgi:hypothetical protein
MKKEDISGAAVSHVIHSCLFPRPQRVMNAFANASQSKHIISLHNTLEINMRYTQAEFTQKYLINFIDMSLQIH